MNWHIIIDERGEERWLDNLANVRHRHCRIGKVKMKDSSTWPFWSDMALGAERV